MDEKEVLLKKILEAVKVSLGLSKASVVLLSYSELIYNMFDETIASWKRLSVQLVGV